MEDNGCHYLQVWQHCFKGLKIFCALVETKIYFNLLLCKPAKPGLKWNRASYLIRPKVAALYISGHLLSQPNPALTFSLFEGSILDESRGWILTKNKKLQHSKYSWIASTQNNTGFPDIESWEKP